MEFFAYALLGAVAGISAGLLGIGGGLIMVPVLLLIFPLVGISGEHLVQLAIGTSLAAIIFGSVSSVWTHHRHGAVKWRLFMTMAPGVTLGALAGSYGAHFLPGEVLKTLFGLLELVIAAQLFFGRNPPPKRQLPRAPGLVGMGGGIGALGSIMGMGGGALSTPFFLWCNVVPRNAIATSAAIGLPTSIAGTIGYIVSGWSLPSLPDHALGYVYLPALLGIVAFSMMFAPLGANLAQKLRPRTLKRIFALMLALLGLYMLAS
ncbi:MAG: sulfite exporter TauE/SafE family protein [Halothiobacillaceae bacterium]